MKCYDCEKLGHPTYKSLEKTSSSYGEKRIAYVQGNDSQRLGEVDLELEKGESLILMGVLVKEPVKEEAKQRR